MNKTCKDCIHYDVCQRLDVCFKYYNVPSPIHLPETCSDFFKDKSRYIELPCAVGQKVYRISGNFCGEKIYEGVIDQIVVKDGKKISFYVYGHPLHFTTDDIGKTVFLAKEEAEQALKGGVEE